MKHFNETHGGTNTRLYNIYHSMKGRCTNKNNEKYPIYGGRGITICSNWMNRFENFRDWATKNGYKDDLTIDRIDNNGNYEPSNCRWVDLFTQAKNKSRLQSNNTSGYRGVTQRSDTKRWRTRIHINNKMIDLGTFDYPYTAAYVYDSYVIKHNLEHPSNFT